MTKTVGIVSLGCDKNRVDTETMLFRLSQGGYRVTDKFEDAEVIIVNTCAFIESARIEAIDTILAAADYKNSGKCEKLIVTGCLPQKYRADLSELTEADALLGTDEYDRIVPLIESLYCGADGEQSQKSSDTEQMPTNCSDEGLFERRIRTTPAHYAYLKIAEGCDNHCTFCTIPSIRGKFRSRTIDSLAAEARDLADDGVRELILVAQDVTAYGADIGTDLVSLIRRLSELDFVWIRLLYCYPERVTDELIAEIDNNPKVAKYIDIPLQHVSDGVLRRMNRKSTHDSIARLFDRIRAAKNKIAVRTTLMVGFPGETEEQFAELCDFVRDCKPDHVGVFAYSREPSTPSHKLKGHISKAEKRRRVDEIGRLHYENCVQSGKNAVGSVQKVLYEDIDYDRAMFKGRTQYSAPDIDAYIYFTADFADVGNFYDVTVTKPDGYDLIGVKTPMNTPTSAEETRK